jgi:hypothetical protein
MLSGCKKIYVKDLRRNQMSHESNVYVTNGYKDRDEYLDSLADNWGIDPETVHMLADMLGPSEDFDGLVTELEDNFLT